MLFHDEIGIGGRIELIARDAAGAVVDTRRAKNLVTLQGRSAQARCFAGREAPTGALFMAVGTGSRPPALTDERLEAEVADLKVPAISTEPEVRIEGGFQRVITTVSATFPAPTDGATQALTEGGIWMELAGGRTILFNRVVFPAISRAPGVSLNLSWEIVF